MNGAEAIQRPQAALGYRPSARMKSAQNIRRFVQIVQKFVRDFDSGWDRKRW